MNEKVENAFFVLVFFNVDVASQMRSWLCCMLPFVFFPQLAFSSFLRHPSDGGSTGSEGVCVCVMMTTPLGHFFITVTSYISKMIPPRCSITLFQFEFAESDGVHAPVRPKQTQPTIMLCTSTSTPINATDSNNVGNETTSTVQ